MNKRFTRAFIVVGLGLLNACATEKVVETPATPEPIINQKPPVTLTPLKPLVMVVEANLSDGEVAVTEMLDPTTGKRTITTTSKPAQLTFRAARGSASGNIIGYRITSAKIGSGVNVIDPNQPITQTGLSIYIQSGFSCVPMPPAKQSCPTVEGSAPTHGLESEAILINAKDLESAMKSDQSNATETFNIVFSGLDGNGKAFEVPVYGVSFIGQYNRIN